ncbi:DEAD/DEAH box helicase family protein [Clostridium sp. WILCCON 0269]|uniref:DEAD/DEAH box helicase family protein n=1 Tax=Candidatus Clostridium eludens TaxID=3381663 RepID=A0ABW8SFB5_9CLOT
MNKRISEIIQVDDIKQWNKGDIITITAGTGVGKSYFVKNILYTFARGNNKKILMLIHRKNCIEQFKQEITEDGKDDVIDIQTYQKLETIDYKIPIQYDFINTLTFFNKDNTLEFFAKQTMKTKNKTITCNKESNLPHM